MDPFGVLGIQPGASDKAIRAAYLRRARELHPDMGGSDEAMRELNAAYEAVSSTTWPAPEPEPDPRADQFVYEPPRRVAPTEPPRVKKPKKPIYKRKRYYVLAGIGVVFLLTSGATESPSPKTKPEVYGLIGRCVELVDNDIDAVVPCSGPHDAWVVDVVPRPEGVCPPLATRNVATISHLICINTDR